MPKEPVQDESVSKQEALEAQIGTEEQESIIKERERRVAEARKLNLLSNTFMTVVLDAKLACQHVLRIVTGIADLEVKEVRTQYRIAKLSSHDAILDVLAEDRRKQLYNLEIQRSETIDHARRTRFYGSMIDSEYLAKGKDYDELPEVHILYISETDLWKAGKTTYEVEKYFKGTNVKYDDGIHVVYVNAEVDDGTAVAQLMQYFKTANPQDMSQGSLSERVHFLKCEEGGYEIMCEMSEKWLEEGRAEGEKKKAREIALNLADMGMSVENISQAVKINIAIVRQWIEGSVAAR